MEACGRVGFFSDHADLQEFDITDDVVSQLMVDDQSVGYHDLFKNSQRTTHENETTYSVLVSESHH